MVYSLCRPSVPRGAIRPYLAAFTSIRLRAWRNGPNAEPKRYSSSLASAQSALRALSQIPPYHSPPSVFLSTRKIPLERCYSYSWAHFFLAPPFFESAAFLSTLFTTPTATVCRMSRTAKRPRGGYSVKDSTTMGFEGSKVT